MTAAAASFSPDEVDGSGDIEDLRARLTEASTRADQLEKAIVTRDVIATAKGILMATERLPRDEAFEVLRRASQRENLPVREIAERLVSTHEERLAGG